MLLPISLLHTGICYNRFMFKTILTLDLLSNAENQYWRSDYEVVEGFKYKFDVDEPWLSISKAELDDIDVRLFPVLTKLNENSAHNIDGRHVYLTIRLWKDAPVFLEPESGFPPQYIIAVEEVNAIEDDTIPFRAVVGETDTVANITYVNAVQRYMLFESIEWFECNYPGGCGRLVAGLGLDMRTEDLVAYVFDTKAPTTKTENIVLPFDGLM